MSKHNDKRFVRFVKMMSNIRTEKGETVCYFCSCEEYGIMFNTFFNKFTEEERNNFNF